MPILNSSKIPWYLVYREIADGLNAIYEQYHERSGPILYDSLLSIDNFQDNNRWIKNFVIPKKKVKSIDPIHLFSSFNSNKLNYEKRLVRINDILELLGKQRKEAIDFEGCPFPTIIYLLSVRTEESQKEIWEVFHKIINDADSLSRTDFDKQENWHGVGFNSFTIFLFWIDSKNFLPLDSNTLDFLLSINALTNTPKDYESYTQILKLKDSIDFKELSIVAYKNMYKKEEHISYTQSMKAFLEHKDLSNISKVNFKIIGLQVRKYNNVKTLFSPEEYYLFHDCFSIINKFEVKYFPEKEVNVYSAESCRINISAIVGKNGSGKSTIAEILYAAINNLAKKGITNESIGKLGQVKHSEYDIYIITNFLFRIEVINSSVSVFKYKFDKNKYIQPEKIPIKEFIEEHFFYTIAINYSHYSLNTKITGRWLEPLFHKNDSYQTPLVINPKRKNGNIDINNENALVVSRLLTMILFPLPMDEDNKHSETNSFRCLKNDGINFKIAHTLKLELNTEKLRSYNLKTDEFRLTVIHKDNLLKEVYNIFNIDSKYLDSQVFTIRYANEYILRKIFRIISTYYRQFRPYLDDNNEIINTSGFIKELNTHTSHITFKLKQAINFLKFDHLKELKRDTTTSISVKNLADEISEIRSKNSNIRIVELIPPSFFNVDIFVRDNLTQLLSNFKDLSSGEKQRNYSISSLIYHLINIDSVLTKSGIIAYKRVNVIFDEIELYYHPDLQRKFINDLLNSIKILNPYLERITDINFCFITHSPFILSDIFKQNVLMLETNDAGRIVSANIKEQTFGANTHELLSDTFFMTTTMGDFAKEKINEIIDFHHSVQKCDLDGIVKLREEYKDKKEEFKFIVQNIGEEFISGILNNHIEFIDEALKEFE